MLRYIAFLRGINVSGQKIIKMELLRNVLSDSGFADVKTYIQSGNVVFNSDNSDPAELIQLIEDLIEKSFGFRTDVILRKTSDIEAIVSSPLFNTLKSDLSKKYYITFLKSSFIDVLTLPLFSKNGDVEIIYSGKTTFISISTLYKGNYGFPNAFIEKLTRIPATTRNPNTLEKLLTL
jgi:uncharacterized protein (DUF1697 family)